MRDYWEVVSDIKRAQENRKGAERRGNDDLAVFWRKRETELKEEKTHYVKKGRNPYAQKRKKKEAPQRTFGIYINEMSDVKKFKPTAYTYVSICGRTSKNISWGSGHETQLSGNGYRISGATHGRKGGE